MSPLRHRSVFKAKSAENGELRKVRFLCPASFVLPGPPNSLVFRQKPAPSVCSAPPKSPVSNASACRGTPQSQPASDAAARRGAPHITRQPAEVLPRDAAARRACHRRSQRSLTRQPAEVPGRNRTSETSLRRPTPKPCHHGLLLPVPNGAFRPKNGLTAMSPLRHRSLWGQKVRKRLGKAKSEIRPRSIPKLDWGLVRAWRRPGNPALGTGMLPQSCAGNRIASAIPAPHTGLP